MRLPRGFQIFTFLLFLTFSVWAEKAQIAVSDLENRGVTKEEALIITDAIASEFLNTRMVRVMERSQMQAVLGEQGFQQSGACNSNECAVQMGQMLGIDYLVVGSVGKLGTVYVLNLRLLDMATAEILYTKNLTVAGGIEMVLTDAAPKLVSDMARGFTKGSKAVTQPEPAKVAPVVAPTPVAQPTPEPAKPEPAKPEPAPEAKPAPTSIDPQVKADSKPTSLKSIAKWTSLGLGVVFGGAALYFNSLASSQYNEYKAINDDGLFRGTSEYEQRQTEIDAAGDKYQSTENLALYSAIASGVFFSGSVVLFVF
jgi:TolB-like protein